MRTGTTRKVWFVIFSWPLLEVGNDELLHFFVYLTGGSAPGTAGRRSRNQRQCFHMAPLMDGPVEHGGVVSQISGDEIRVRCLQPDFTIGNKLLVRLDATGGEYLLQPGGRKQRWVLGSVDHRVFPKEMS